MDFLFSYVRMNCILVSSLVVSVRSSQALFCGSLSFVPAALCLVLRLHATSHANPQYGLALQCQDQHGCLSDAHHLTGRHCLRLSRQET